MVPPVWTILEEFGYNHILQELNGDRVNRLENVMTLAKDVHSDFDALAIWLVPSDDPNAEPNTYKLESSLPFLLQAYPRVVRFQSSDPGNLPLPSPRYLEIHASCAKIAHLSGANVYVDGVMRDCEDLAVLADDGSSAELLKHLLIQTRPREVESDYS
ncbi:hypothetical protein CC2G_011218 [Coprinopsis cinerea AmutBmut pab1-1]|nr:hypothetical protein CC2G_011218 [Coprinopsis cinerea AmutBmut pab1-1]